MADDNTAAPLDSRSSSPVSIASQTPAGAPPSVAALALYVELTDGVRALIAEINDLAVATKFISSLRWWTIEAFQVYVLLKMRPHGEPWDSLAPIDAAIMQRKKDMHEIVQSLEAFPQAMPYFKFRCYDGHVTVGLARDYAVDFESNMSSACDWANYTPRIRSFSPEALENARDLLSSTMWNIDPRAKHPQPSVRDEGMHWKLYGQTASDRKTAAPSCCRLWVLGCILLVVVCLTEYRLWCARAA